MAAEGRRRKPDPVSTPPEIDFQAALQGVPDAPLPTREELGRRLTHEARSEGTRRANRTRKETPPTRESVVLAYRHMINGVVYGPGRVTGPIPLIRQLAENDGRAMREEDDCLDRNGRAFVIGFPGASGVSKRPVNYDRFDVAMQQIDPGISVRGGRRG